MPKHDEFLDSKTLIHKKEGLQVVHQDRRRNCYIPLYRSIKPLCVPLSFIKGTGKSGWGLGEVFKCIHCRSAENIFKSCSRRVSDLNNSYY